MTNEAKSQRPTLVVGAVIYSDENEIMICQRQVGDHGEGLWEFPGGKVEPDEDNEAALKREIMEELSVNCEVEEFIAEKEHKYESSHIRLALYFVKLESEDVELNDHDDYEWVNEETIKNFEMTAADLPFVDEIFKKLKDK